MISMAARVIFWTADLRVTASTRIGALPPSSWQVPAPSCCRTRMAGRGAYAIDQRNGNARYLVAALQMERTNLSRDHRLEPGRLDVQPRNCLQTQSSDELRAAKSRSAVIVRMVNAIARASPTVNTNLAGVLAPCSPPHAG